MKNNKVPTLRFKSEKSEWSWKYLKDISKKITDKNKDNQYTETLTNSAELGIINQRDYFDKDISNKKNLNGYYIVKPDDFVYNPRISIFAPVGPIKRNKLGRTGVMSPLYYVFRTQHIDLAYLEAYFSSVKWHLYMKQNGDSGARSDRFSIKDSVFGEMPIPYPSKEIQKKIGSFFKKLDDTISLHQQELEALKQTKQGFLQKMFPKDGEIFPEVRFKNFVESWREVSLGAISDSYSGGTPSAGNKQYYNGTIPFIRSAEINSSTTELFLTEEGLSNSSAKLVQKGTILYAMYGATSGEVGISRIDGAINQAILAIKPKEEYDIQFLYQYLKKSKKSIVNSYLQGGQGNLSGAIIKKVPIWLPENREEQIKIGEFFRQLDEVIELKGKELEALKETKKGFIQKMFV